MRRSGFMPEGLPIVDLCVLVTYLGGVVELGCALISKSSSTDEFVAAGRSLSGWVVGLSIFGTYVSSISFLANPGKRYADNWNSFVFSLSLPVAAWIAVRYFVPVFRQGGMIWHESLAGLRSAFNEVLTIVFGTMTILMVDMFLAYVFPVTRPSAQEPRDSPLS